MKNINYILSDKEEKKLNEFIKEKNDALIDKQRKTMEPEEFKFLTGNGEYPYTGAIGGGVTYHITPNSIGCGIAVTYLGEYLDLTDYESW